MNAKQQAALRLLLKGKSQIEAAREVGVDVRTVRRWQESREFQDAYSTEVQELLRAAAVEAQRSLFSAIAALREIVIDKQQSGATRVSAARALLDFGVKLAKNAEETEERGDEWII